MNVADNSTLKARFSGVVDEVNDSDWGEVLARAGMVAQPGRRGPFARLLLATGAAFTVGIALAAALGVRLHPATAASPPGPKRVERHVGNGTVHWLFAHELRGQSLTEAHIPLLSTVGAHWQPVKFARVITPDPQIHAKIVLSLIGKRGRNVCMTLVYPYSGGGGCAVGLLLKPFNFGITSHMDPACSRCGGIVISGVASDDVARMELFLPQHKQRGIPLKDNVFLISLPPSTPVVNLVAYDRRGLVIGRAVPRPFHLVP